MTNLNKFAAQQLTKKQMNEVCGGAQDLYECTFTTETGTYVQYVMAENKILAEAEIQFSGVEVNDVIVNNQTANRPTMAVGLLH